MSSAQADRAQKYLAAVSTFAEKVLACGTDRYGPERTPLFVDGVEVRTLQPVQWNYRGTTWTLSNQASQQRFFRVLDGLTALTGQEKYRDSAKRAIRYAFDHLRSDNGLLYWGGHTCWDVSREQWAGRLWSGGGRGRPIHELKYHLPHYELMRQVDAVATKRLIEAIWRGHMRDWAILDLDRHAEIRGKLDGKLWDHEYTGGAVFFAGIGRTFSNIGTDLIYAAGLLHAWTGRPGPLIWAKRLAERYDQTRNPKTGLRGYQYSYRPPDRAREQFGPELPGHLVLEGTILKPLAMIKMAGVELMLSERLGQSGEEFKQWAMKDLRALANVAYDRRANVYKPMLTDGYSLEGFAMPRDGYYGKKGQVFRAAWLGGTDLRVYALAYRVSDDPLMWRMAGDVAKANGLGEIGRPDGSGASLNMETTFCDGEAIFGLLELARKTGRDDFLALACRIADNILENRFVNGFFLADRFQKYARFDRIEPLALLHLAAALRGKSQAVPPYWGGGSYFACEWDDGEAYTYDLRVIYPQRVR